MELFSAGTKCATSSAMTVATATTASPGVRLRATSFVRSAVLTMNTTVVSDARDR